MTRSTRRRLLTGSALALPAFLILVPLASSELRFVLRSAYEEARILLRRQPIEELVADSTTSAERRAQLALVLAARDFAESRLGLAARETFTTFSDVGQGTLLYVVSASPRDRLEGYTWSYPLIGAVPYKGFFAEEDARAEARRLERLGHDTYVRPAGAFSTLGWFNDPLLSTSLDDDPVELVSTVIHEIAHNTLWVPGDVPFNESYANFVGYRGAEAFFASRGERESARRSAAIWRDEKRLGDFFTRLERELQELYGSGLERRALESRRREIFARAKSTLAGPLDRELEVYSGRRLSRRALNNATVIARRLYVSGLDELDRTLWAKGGDLRAGIREIARSIHRDPARRPMEVVALLNTRLARAAG